MKGDSATLWPEIVSADESSKGVHRVPAPDFILQRIHAGERFQCWTLDVGRGRQRDRLFCSENRPTCGSASQQIHVFESVAERLAAELAWRQPLPQIVQIGTLLDPFCDCAEARLDVLKVIKLLAERKIISWLMTRGKIDGSIAEQWTNYPDWIRVSLPVVSHDKTVQAVFEPNAARLEERLDSYRRLNQQSIRTEVILEPMLPNLTDTREHLEELLEYFALAGVTHVTAGYLVLRPEMKETMAAALEPSGWSELVLSSYSDGVRIRKGPHAPALMLSKARRQRGYALLMALAANVDISIRLSSRSNPDFGSTSNR